MEFLPIDIINYINGFLQRTDQIVWKITSKYYLTNLKHNLMDLNGELNLFTKTIDELDYAWKDDTRYINICSFPQQLANYDILNSYAVINNLWYFDFNAEFDVYADNYIILFVTSVSYYQINIEHIDGIGQITKSKHKPISNKIKVKFDSKGKIKVNCREITKHKDLKTVQYIMCIPEYYWNKIKNLKEKHFDWKKQIVMTRDGLTGMKMIKSFN